MTRASNTPRADDGAASRGGGRITRLVRIYARFAPLVAPHRARMVLAAFCIVGFIVTGLLAPWPVQAVIDGVLLERPARGLVGWLAPVLPAGRGSLLLACCLLLLALSVLRGWFSYGQHILAATVGHSVVSELRVALFTKLQRLSLAFHGERRTGDLLVRLTGDVSMLREVLVPAVLEIVSQVLMLGGMMLLMALMDPALTLIAVAMVPLLGLVTVRFGSRLRDAAHEQRRKEGRIAAVAGEALASVAVVQAFSREDLTAARFGRQSQKSLTAGLRALRLEESLARIVELTLAGGSALVLWAGARRVMSGAVSPGELVVFLTYVRGIYKPLQSLVRVASRASKAVACGERVLEVLDSQEQVQEADDAVEAPPLEGEIVFENVTYGYTPGRPVLEHISFRISAGEKVGIVGPSGSGKSTIAALLLRLREPDSGRILVDGTDIRSFRLESYRRQVAVVLQEPFLFGVSVEENIRYGRVEASLEQVHAAARAAEAERFITSLPESWQTVLGERGASLSRGQQQRIALARAVLREAPVLLFDEPTTGLDPRTEGEVLATLAALGKDRTCVWIAHDLDQILGCTNVLVLRDGRIVEQGPPTALMEGRGAFQTLFGTGAAR